MGWAKAIKTEALRLRLEDRLSVRDIQATLRASHGHVPKRTVALWVEKHPLSTVEQQALLSSKGYSKGGRTVRVKWETIRGQAQRRGRRMAKTLGKHFTAGCFLYWGEGSKRRNRVQITNSDWRLLRFFRDFLRRFFDVADEKIRVTINCFTDIHDLKEIEEFWLEHLDVPRDCLCKPTVNCYSRASKHKRLGVLPYGTCALSVGDVRIVQAIYGAIQEISGLENTDWLNLVR